MAGFRVGNVPVWVVHRADRGKFTLVWDDPKTGKRRRKTIDARTRNAAYVAAGELRAKLSNPDPVDCETGDPWTWDRFCTRYREKLLATSSANQGKWKTVSELVSQEFDRRGIDPYLKHIDREFLESVADRLRTDRGNAESTVRSAIATLRSGLNYAAGFGWMPPVPRLVELGRQEQRSAEMRGRPLTTEEFERILAQVRRHKITKHHPHDWDALLRALWLGGLRISEALSLHRRSAVCHRPVDLFTRRPKILFLSSQKNRRDQRVAITPDFAEFLRKESNRGDGYFFSPAGPRSQYATSKAVGRVLTALAKKARVTTAPDHYATAHDLRRSFARRWASRVMPPVLQHLMRHSSIETTLKFYVGSDADAMASAIRESWERSGCDHVNVACEEAGEAVSDR